MKDEQEEVVENNDVPAITVRVSEDQSMANEDSWENIQPEEVVETVAVSYTHLTLPTIA